MIKNQITKAVIRVIPFIIYILMLTFFLIIYFNGGVIYFWDGGFPIFVTSFIQRYINAWNYPLFPGGAFFGFMLYLPVALYEFFISQILKLPISFSEISLLEIFGVFSYIGFHKTTNFLIERSDIRLSKNCVALISAITSFFISLIIMH